MEEPEGTTRDEAEIRARLHRLENEISTLSHLLRGNGGAGLRTQFELLQAHVESLRAQWKWIVGVLTAVAVAMAQASLKR